jgi:hypothetical protein
MRRSKQCVMAGIQHSQKPDHRHGRLLSARRERPRRRAAEQRDELAAFASRASDQKG